MTASRIPRWERGGKHSQSTIFGMCLFMFEHWLPKELTAWAAGCDEIGALLDYVRAGIVSSKWCIRMNLLRL